MTWKRNRPGARLRLECAETTMWMRRVLLAALAWAWAGGALAQTDPGRASGDVWSRVTLETPIYTRHFPNDGGFNDQNWGGFVDVALNDDWSAVAGDFRNSYRRNTAFAAVSWEPLKADVSGLRLAFGGMAGVDLNGGYRGYNNVEPLLGAFNLRIAAANPHRALERFGLLFTIIPPAARHGATALNVALTYRLP